MTPGIDCLGFFFPSGSDLLIPSFLVCYLPVPPDVGAGVVIQQDSGDNSEGCNTQPLNVVRRQALA